MMDFRTVVTISTILLMTREATADTNTSETPPHTQADSTSSHCVCSSAAPPAATPPNSIHNSSAPVLGLLTVRWRGACDGGLVLYNSSGFFPVCQGSEKNVQSLLTNVCKNKKGCNGTLRWTVIEELQSGYHISEGGAEQRSSCNTLRIQCKVEVPHGQGELRAYKVVTALFCCVLLVLFLIRFYRPTVKALQKRLSDRRQNRWIGPTQSHSVSYHRGKTVVKNSEGEKRLSYPALERLAVSDSREPSSNRNSDYNL